MEVFFPGLSRGLVRLQGTLNATIYLCILILDAIETDGPFQEYH